MMSAILVAFLGKQSGYGKHSYGAQNDRWAGVSGAWNAAEANNPPITAAIPERVEYFKKEPRPLAIRMGGSDGR